MSHKVFMTKFATLFSLSFVVLTTVSTAQPKRVDTEDGKSPNNFRKETRRMGELEPKNVKHVGDIEMGLRSIAFPSEFRTINGTENNLEHPHRGASDSLFIRLVPNQYEDGIGTPSGADRPNARVISNAISDQRDQVRLPENPATDMLWQWGQFLDHDITLTPVSDPEEPFPIEVPVGDPDFDPQATGGVEISMERSFYDDENGVREQVNEITAYIDASQVYGSNLEIARELRTLDGTGQLLTSPGDLLPFNTNGFPNAPRADAPNFFLAGDFRSNEQVGLTSLHTLFVREHNYWAGVIARSNEALNGEQIYEIARSIVGAEMQIITYEEFLPTLLGPRAIPRYKGYQADVDPGISNVFATAGYRFGHSMLSSQLLRLDRRLRETEGGHLDLASAFFNPSLLQEEGGIDPIIRGLIYQPAQEIDTFVVDDVRNFLFGRPGAGGFDLAALNIQRGRDHGLGSYNDVRRAFQLRPARRFSDITRNRELQERLRDVYETVEMVDPWVGALAEDHLRGARVGETLLAVLRDQFTRLRDGDRFWYENHLSPELQRLLRTQTLAKIIRRNTAIKQELPRSIWLASDRRFTPQEEPKSKGAKALPRDARRGGPRR